MEKVRQRLVNSPVKVTHSIVESDHVGSTLCKIAEENRSDLIIVGDTGRSELSKLVLGSVPNYVLRHSTSSVLICRGR
jgi:nucleotide-binding universal stress UspA family protein